MQDRAYYRDVHVWLPDVRWETTDKRYMPYCPNCKTNARVGPHCFRDNHAGRVIVGQTETYYTVSRRYICYECEDHSKKQKANFEAAAKEQDLTATVELDDAKYAFQHREMYCYYQTTLLSGRRFEPCIDNNMIVYMQCLLRFPATTIWIFFDMVLVDEAAR